MQKLDEGGKTDCSELVLSVEEENELKSSLNDEFHHFYSSRDANIRVEKIEENHSLVIENKEKENQDLESRIQEANEKVLELNRTFDEMNEEYEREKEQFAREEEAFSGVIQQLRQLQKSQLTNLQNQNALVSVENLILQSDIEKNLVTLRKFSPAKREKLTVLGNRMQENEKLRQEVHLLLARYYSAAKHKMNDTEAKE